MSGINGNGWWRPLGVLALEIKCFNCGVRIKKDVQDAYLAGKNVISFLCPRFTCNQPYEYHIKEKRLIVVNVKEKGHEVH